MRKMKIIFVGYAVNPQDSEIYSGISVAGNKMQANILKSLSKIKTVDLKVISVRPVATFPNEKKWYFSKSVASILDDVYAVNIPFINLPFFKQLSQIRSVEKALERELKKSEIKNTIVFSFNMFPQVGIPVVRMMKKYGVEAVSLLADLPIDDASSRGVISRILRTRFDASTRKSIYSLKHAVVLNKTAAERYAPNADYIVIDGGVDKETVSNYSPEFSVYTKKSKNMVYGGSLNLYSGAITLAKAMKFIPNDDVFLDIYGSGDGEKELKQLAQVDRRIRVHGRVDNAAMLQKQREAYLLINPRPTHDPISEVTFPSKIFEYMLSGTPVISTRLNGFSPDYNEKIMFFEREDEESFALEVVKAMSMPHDELNGYAKRAYEYVVKEKQWDKQVGRIYEYCKRIKGWENENWDNYVLQW